MAKSKFFILLLVLAACGRHHNAAYAGFEQYVDSFVIEGMTRDREVDLEDLQISFVDTITWYPNVTSSTVGLCIPDDTRVEILKSFWDGISEARRENLIFHELGHCLLDKEHTTCPNVMCPYVLTSDIYEAHRKEYLDVLFKD